MRKKILQMNNKLYYIVNNKYKYAVKILINYKCNKNFTLVIF